VISHRGSTNFEHPSWHGFDLRGHLEKKLGLPVIYNNDGNAAALYAHRLHFGVESPSRSSVSAVVGTGLGGGIVHRGQVVYGATGAAGELGHVQIPMSGLLEPDQPEPRCNCGFVGDAESIASLTGIVLNLLPYWLSRYPDHELASVPLSEAARRVRSYGEAHDPMAIRLFEQQAAAIGRLFTIAANFLDPDAYFVGGGVVEASEDFGGWFLGKVRENTTLREEAASTASFALVPDLDMAGARGAALAALGAL
jgi:predicted NBD/HSP70 family sugar kinase